MHIEIREQRSTAERRADAVRRLDGLDLIDAGQGELHLPDEPPSFAIVADGVVLPVVASAYEVVAGESGPVVTVSLPAESVSVGLPVVAPLPARAPSRPTPDRAVADAIRDAVGHRRPGQGGRATWGAPAGEDPRASIPGWAPEQPAEVSRG